MERERLSSLATSARRAGGRSRPAGVGREHVRSPALRQPAAQLGLAQQSDHALGEHVGTAGGRDERRLAVQRVVPAALRVGARERRSAGKRLDAGQAQPLLPAGKHEHRGFAQQIRDLRSRRRPRNVAGKSGSRTPKSRSSTSGTAARTHASALSPSSVAFQSIAWVIIATSGPRLPVGPPGVEDRAVQAGPDQLGFAAMVSRLAGAGSSRQPARGGAFQHLRHARVAGVP